MPRIKGFDYQTYLASREWSLLREQVRERSGDRCEHCLMARQQAVHHLTYANIGHESLDDLMAVCNPCHEWFSGKTDVNPIANWCVTPALNAPIFEGSFRPWHYFIRDPFKGPAGEYPVMWVQCREACYWCTGKEIDKNWVLYLDKLSTVVNP